MALVISGSLGYFIFCFLLQKTAEVICQLQLRQLRKIVH